MGDGRGGDAEVESGRREAKRQLGKPAIAALFVAAYMFFAAGRFAFRVDRAWYEALAKPSWALPLPAEQVGWLIAFGLLAASAVFAFLRASGTRTGKVVLGLRVVHYLVLQALVYLLFSRQALLPAAFDATVLAVLAAAIAVASGWKTRRGAWLSGAYTAWATYNATVVWGLWALNR